MPRDRLRQPPRTIRIDRPERRGVARLDQSRRVDDHGGARHQPGEHGLIAEIPEHEVQRYLGQHGMQGRPACQKPDGPARSRERRDDIAPQKPRASGDGGKGRRCHAETATRGSDCAR